MNLPPAVNYLAFAALMITTFFGYQSLWGLLFIYWTVPNFYTGRTVLLSPVARREDPLLFWLVQMAWILLGLMLIAADFIGLEG